MFVLNKRPGLWSLFSWLTLNNSADLSVTRQPIWAMQVIKCHDNELFLTCNTQFNSTFLKVKENMFMCVSNFSLSLSLCLADDAKYQQQQCHLRFSGSKSYPKHPQVCQ